MFGVYSCVVGMPNTELLLCPNVYFCTFIWIDMHSIFIPKRSCIYVFVIETIQ